LILTISTSRAAICPAGSLWPRAASRLRTCAAEEKCRTDLSTNAYALASLGILGRRTLF
jgi:hypothetical protein